jgi:hypothetical protein
MIFHGRFDNGTKSGEVDGVILFKFVVDVALTQMDQFLTTRKRQGRDIRNQASELSQRSILCGSPGINRFDEADSVSHVDVKAMPDDGVSRTSTSRRS